MKQLAIIIIALSSILILLNRKLLNKTQLNLLELFTIISLVFLCIGFFYQNDFGFKLSSIFILLIYLYEKPFADKSLNNRLLLNIGGIVSIILIAI